MEEALALAEEEEDVAAIEQLQPGARDARV